MRLEELFLSDIVQSADAIERTVIGRSFVAFLADEDALVAVLLRLIAIGEAAARLPLAVGERYPDLPWRDMVASRNRAVHAYFAIDWTIVWDTATDAVPGRRDRVAKFIVEDDR